MNSSEDSPSGGESLKDEMCFGTKDLDNRVIESYRRGPIEAINLDKKYFKK